MKTAIIYYSLEGNMDYIAKRIALDDAADLYRLIPKKEYPTGKVSKYVWGGKSATFGENPTLANEKFDLDKYDTLIIGSPVWAGRTAPPLNSFFADYKICGKNIILVATCASGSTDKLFAKMKEHLQDNEIKGTYTFVEPLHSQEKSINEKISEIRKLITA